MRFRQALNSLVRRIFWARVHYPTVHTYLYHNGSRYTIADGLIEDMPSILTSQSIIKSAGVPVLGVFRSLDLVLRRLQRPFITINHQNNSNNTPLID